MKNGIWIWKYKDFEFYHGMKYLLAREERGKKVPAFYTVPHFSHSVRFVKNIDLVGDEKISVYADGDPCIFLDGERLNGAREYVIPRGQHKMMVCVANAVGMCALKIMGENLFTDESWISDDYSNQYAFVGTSPLCKNADQVPSDYVFPESEILPASDTVCGNERIIAFEKNTFVRLVIEGIDPGVTTEVKYGESLAETYSDRCVITDRICGKSEVVLPERACQYVRFIGDTAFKISARYPRLPVQDISTFQSEQDMTAIYDISKYTLELCARMFLLDGIKRDRWPWAGDTFLTAGTNYYCFFDKELVKRTLILLRGNDGNGRLVNNIPCFSLYWFMALRDYYRYTGDLDFIKRNYTSIVEHVAYITRFCDDDGLLTDIPGAWNFIDHHDIINRGKVCCIQMLFGKALECVAELARLCGDADTAEKYGHMYANLKDKINRLYWDEKQGGYVSTILGGAVSDQIRRHQNYFAILFDYADEERTEIIMKHVLENEKIPKITTPFFKFFENDVLCKLGKVKEAFANIRKYWGDMLREGATTFWEEYDSDVKGEQKYAMYGEPFDKSLCHAWSAVPIYFIGKYLAGVTPTEAGYRRFAVRPVTDLADFSIKVPTERGSVAVSVKNGFLRVLADHDGGVLILGEEQKIIPPNTVLEVSL